MDGNHELFYAMKPPAHFKFENPAFRLRIPKDDRYFVGEYAYQIVNSIAEMYEMKIQRLIDLFSKSMDEIRSEITHEKPGKMKKAMLEHAAWNQIAIQ